MPSSEPACIGLYAPASWRAIRRDAFLARNCPLINQALRRPLSRRGEGNATPDPQSASSPTWLAKRASSWLLARCQPASPHPTKPLLTEQQDRLPPAPATLHDLCEPPGDVRPTSRPVTSAIAWASCSSSTGFSSTLSAPASKASWTR